jgi:hypothetical protein
MNVTIYIRVEDEEKWGSIEDVPGWVHEHLNEGVAGFTEIKYRGVPVGPDDFTFPDKRNQAAARIRQRTQQIIAERKKDV